jgi:hypothetical protein
VRKRENDEAGLFQWVIEVHEIPVQPSTDYPSMDNPSTDNRTSTNTDCTKTEGTKKREEAGADAGADALPSTFKDWHELVRVARDKGAVIRLMCEHYYPGLDPPTVGLCRGAAAQVGGWGRLCELVFREQTRPPTGNIMKWCIGVHKARGKQTDKMRNQERKRATERSEYADVVQR